MGSENLRTAVLVLHGMGSQRPLDTVRGVVEAVWRSAPGEGKRLWVHPEPSGIDLDLSVFLTNALPESGNRRVYFHELYWAHLMSETRATALLLWLFELARKGPTLHRRIQIVWWVGAIFLSYAMLSIALLAVHAVQRLAGIGTEPDALLFVPLMMLLAALGGLFLYAMVRGAWRFAVAAALGAGVVALCTWAADAKLPDQWLNTAIHNLMPLSVALVAASICMGRWGLLTTFVAYAGSLAVVAAAASWFDLATGPDWSSGTMPWSLTSPSSVVAACVTLALYLALNALFLQSYLGDAARYFRNSPANVKGRREIRKQAVDMLESLHQSGKYDRIIVVAHSLGAVVAYDMLRAYFARICRHLPDPNALRPEITDIDQGKGTPEKSRAVIEMMAAMASKSSPGAEAPRAWLVTNFVTLGSPLTHAVYLMCPGRTAAELQQCFERRKDEREYPTRPPRRLDNDGLLLFTPRDGRTRFHHGGLFALTRWTNLYFPMSQVLWGDVIGGPASAWPAHRKRPEMPLFGPGIEDVKVNTKKARPPFFAHTAYWRLEEKWGGADAPHLRALRDAVDLRDRFRS